jgi:hypothetical protein
VTGSRASDDDGTTTDFTALQAELVALWRSLHRFPDIGLNLPRTQRRVLDGLLGLDLEISSGRRLVTSVPVRWPGRCARSSARALPAASYVAGKALLVNGGAGLTSGGFYRSQVSPIALPLPSGGSVLPTRP